MARPLGEWVCRGVAYANVGSHSPFGCFSQKVLNRQSYLLLIMTHLLNGGLSMSEMYLLDEGTHACQYQQGDGMCFHKVALLLAAQVMQEANHPDYHMVAKILAARKLGQAIHLKQISTFLQKNHVV